jgi:hypothetical protein
MDTVRVKERERPARGTQAPPIAARAARGHQLGALSLQRRVGNRTAARLLQRKTVTPVAYLRSIPGERGDTQEWKEQQSVWEDALLTVIKDLDNGTKWLPMRKLDDERPLDVEKFIGALRGIAETADEPTLYRRVLQAVRWYAGIPSSAKGVSGLGTLDVNGRFRGRPSFPSYTLRAVEIKPGQHRRHIFAWHDIREFLWIAYQGYREEVIRTIGDLCANTQQLPEGSRKAIEEATGFSQLKHPGDEVALLKIALFVMNGNPRNLWAGGGRVNIAINSVARSMRDDLAGVRNFNDLQRLAISWKEPGNGTPVLKTAKELGSQLIDVACEQWTTAQHKSPAKEDLHLQRAIKMINNWILSNLDIDVNTPDKEKTEQVQEQWKELKGSIRTMDSVVQGTGRDEGIGAPQIRAAITDFMTYKK